MAIVSRATAADAHIVADAITDAFMDEPVACWLFPDDGTRRDVQAYIFRFMVSHALDVGVALVADGGAGASLWVPIEVGQSVDAGKPLSFDGAGDLGARLKASEERLKLYADLTADCHPTGERHIYLPCIGVRPAHRGAGLGGAMLRRQLAVVDATGAPVYLEATSLRSCALYEQHGFVQIGKGVPLPDGPSVWPMWRHPGERGMMR